ncbi:hypothetical protein [Leifsonia sp. 2MCAF36]|uniref:hypothetical protein n=1 Tax=Leifsonia sp. 2MCAF36 TaxID=3232988 RepID=UPI003F9686B2
MTVGPRYPELMLVRNLRDRSETRQQHGRAAQRGTEVRVARGVYVERSAWEALDDRERYLLRIRAIALTRQQPPIFSHWSAAAMHALPIVGTRPDAIHVSVGRTSGGRSSANVVAHSLDVAAEDLKERDGLLCTSLERTVVDLAAVAPTGAAVAMADHALRERFGRFADPRYEGKRDALRAAWQRAQPMRGHRRSLDVIDFADGRAESPLESVSRVAMHAAGLPRPELQTPLKDAAGLIGYVDFAWPAFGLVGEADGDAKYLDPALRGGRSAEQVVLDEKVREDRLRALGLCVVRWRWATATAPHALANALAAAGLPRDQARSWDECAPR